MPARRSFFDFIKEKCYNGLFDAAKKYLYENWQQMDDVFSRKVPNIAAVHLEDGTVERVYVRDLPGMRVAFDVGFELQVVVYDKERFSDVSDELHPWVRISCEGDLDCGLDDWQITNVASYDKRKAPQNALSDQLVPFIKREELEARATDFLKKYYPEALRKPTYLDPEVLAERLGLSIKTQSITQDGSVFGQIYFADCDTEMYDSKAGAAVPVHVPKNTIVVDPEVTLFCGVGRWGNTIVHECVHWALHRKVFAFEQIYNKSATRITCETVGAMQAEAARQATDMMEYQANTLAPRIQMPIGPFKTQAERLIREYQHKHPALEYVDIIDYVIQELSYFFHVSRQAAKIRMVEAGYEEAIGTYTFVDGRYVQPHSFKRGSLQRNQTYSISVQDAAIQSVLNPMLHALTSGGGYQYVDSHFVLDRPRYLSVDAGGRVTLTNYARTHMDECCLAFDLKVKSKVRDDYHSICYLNREEGGIEFEVSYSGAYANKTVEEKNALLDDMVLEERAIRRKLTGEMKQCGDVLLKWRNTNYQQLALEAGVNERTVRRIFSGEKVPKKMTMVRLCLALHLPPIIWRHLFSITGVSLSLQDDADGWCDFALTHLYKSSIEANLEFLREHGVKNADPYAE